MSVTDRGRKTGDGRRKTGDRLTVVKKLTFQCGDRVLITKSSHPWVGCEGVILGFDRLQALDRSAIRIKLDESDAVPPGHECYAGFDECDVN